VVKKPVPKKAAGKPKGVKGYTDSQYKLFKSMQEKYFNLNVDTLKGILKKNMQTRSGNKDRLVEKCADGFVLGAIPKCPACFGGWPRFDYKKGNLFHLISR
jgi:hypothetical protein